jgi:hypothetical protein
VTALLGAAIWFAGIVSAESGSDEAELIRLLNGRVERHGPSLTLHTNKSAIVFTDISCDPVPVPPDCVSHALVAYDISHHVFVVENGYYEGHDYTWINEETGFTVKIKGLPHYSPSGNRFVVVNADEAFSFNGIQLWRTLGGFAGLEWEYSPAEYALYEFVAWQNDKNIQLRVTTYVDHELKEGLPARLVQRDPGWHLEGPPERSR